MTMLNIDSSTQPANIFCNVVAENNGSHRRFPGTRLAHEQNLLLPLSRVHGECMRTVFVCSFTRLNLSSLRSTHLQLTDVDGLPTRQLLLFVGFALP